MSRNYLWKAKSAAERREYRRFKCNAVVRLVYKRSVAQPIVSIRAVILDISQSGARIRVSATEFPDYFYLVIGRYEYSIGCVVMRNQGNEIGVEFIKEQPQRLVEAFALLSFPMAPLFSLRGLMKNEITQAAASDALALAI